MSTQPNLRENNYESIMFNEQLFRSILTAVGGWASCLINADCCIAGSHIQTMINAGSQIRNLCLKYLTKEEYRRAVEISLVFCSVVYCSDNKSLA